MNLKVFAPANLCIYAENMRRWCAHGLSAISQAQRGIVSEVNAGAKRTNVGSYIGAQQIGYVLGGQETPWQNAKEIGDATAVVQEPLVLDTAGELEVFIWSCDLKDVGDGKTTLGIL